MDSKWLKMMTRFIEVRYSLQVEIDQESYSVNDPYNQKIRVQWDKGSVYIDQSRIGPSRNVDFLEEFRKELKDKYPEELL